MGQLISLSHFCVELFHPATYHWVFGPTLVGCIFFCGRLDQLRQDGLLDLTELHTGRLLGSLAGSDGLMAAGRHHEIPRYVGWFKVGPQNKQVIGSRVFKTLHL